MPLIRDYVTQKLLFGHHPVIDSKQCINTIQQRYPCSKCQEICPTGVFRRDQPDWDRCIGCDLCVSACPSRCITLSEDRLRKQLALVKSHQDTVSVSCMQSDSPADLKVGCLYALDWEYLSLLALFHHIILVFEGCDTCNFLQGSGNFFSQMTRAESFLGKERFRSAFTITKDPADAQAAGYSRRDLLRLAAESSGQKAAVFLSGKDEKSHAGFWRSLLVRAAGAAGAGTLCFGYPVFSENCTACGICEKICPSGAIYRVPDETEKTLFHMAVFPSKCSECGLCEKICPSGAVSAPQPVAEPDPVRPRIRSIRVKLCSLCKEPLLPGDADSGICRRCAAEKGDSSLFW